MQTLGTLAALTSARSVKDASATRRSPSRSSTQRVRDAVPIRRWVACLSVRVVVALLPVVSGCLLGSDPLRGAPNVPTLDGEPALVAPLPDDQGDVWVREGTEVVVELRFVSALDLDASDIRLDDGALDCTQPDPALPTYRCTRTMDGTESNGPKGLAGTVALRALQTTARLATAPLVSADFLPPTAACVLSPRDANATQRITLLVTPSEPLQAPPEIRTSSEYISATFREVVENQYIYDIEGTPDLDLPEYTLSLEAIDRAGNPQLGDSLCDVATRTGAFLGQGPALDGEPTLHATPAVELQGVPWVRHGANLTVTIPTESPIDTDRSAVALSGLLLEPSPTEPNTWSTTLDGSEGDGLKTLDATLIDAAGNTRRVVRPGVIHFDFTPPSASCLLFPADANSSSTIVLQLFASEPLADLGPAITGVEPLTPVLESATASTFTWRLDQPTPRVDLSSFTAVLTATDRVGNAQQGDSLCEPAERTGSLKGIGPDLVGSGVLLVTPSLPSGDGTPRATDGATVTLTLATAEAIDPEASSVFIGNLPLSSLDGQTWTGTLTSGLGDGRKSLSATLVDPAGNRLQVEDAAVALLADFTPPALASAVLTRTPFFASSDDGSGTVWFTSTDPLTKQAVSASLRITSTEDLGVAPELHIHGPGPLGFIPDAGTARLQTWSLPAIPEGQDGAYTFDVTLEDALGNRSEPLALDVTLQLDTVGPSAGPDVHTPDRVTYTRQPWGPSSASGAAVFQVQGLAGAAPPGVLIAVENASGSQLGTGASGSDGAFEVAFGADAPDVFVRAHDRAGNPSPRAAVRDVVWTATMAGKVAGRDQENPHRFDAATLAAPDRRDTPAAVTHELASAVASTVAAPSWLPWEGDGASEQTPSARGNHAMVYDAARGVTVLFGGSGIADACGTLGSPRCSDTWEWDGTTWADVTPVISPPARYNHALAYDAARGVTVLFGGEASPSNRLEDTWEWDGVGWTEVTADVSPPARHNHALAYDAARGVTVLFGGFGASSGRLSDTWVWDGASWSELAPAASPPARTNHALAYDAARGVTVLFGGAGTVGACGTPGSSACADTWAWDGATWTEVTPDVSPPARTQHALAYDAARDVTVLFGGSGAAGACGTPDSVMCSDTWLWDGASWTEVTPDAVPPARRDHAIVYDAARARTVLFGGQGGNDTCGTSGSLCADAWVWDGDTWAEATPSGSPPARDRHALAYDAAREVTVLFGGEGTASGACGAPDSARCADTWVWNGASWVERTPGVSPRQRERHALAYDAVREVTVLFGGTDGASRLSDTWEWNGTTWVQLTPATSPTSRHGHALAYDAARGVTVLFGGFGPVSGACGTPGSGSCSDTWTWDGTTWTELTPATSPPARSNHALVYDPARGVLVLFGGAGACGVPGNPRCADTWEWNGTTWTEVTPATSPPARDRHALVYDAARDATLLFGGTTSGFASGLRSDTWVWEGGLWAELTSVTAPPARERHALAYDTTRGNAILFGGAGAGAGACGTPGQARCADTWLLSTDASLSPRHSFTASFAAALAPDATLRAVTARWVAGGSGTPAGDLTEGAELQVWDGFAWTTLDAHASGHDAPAELCTRLVGDPDVPPVADCADLVDPGLVRNLFRFGPSRTATFAVRPTAPIGTDEGVLRSEDLSVTVRYQLPAE